MADFHTTNMGHRFFESTMPRIAKALETLAKRLEAQPVVETAPAATQPENKKGQFIEEAMQAFEAASKKAAVAIRRELEQLVGPSTEKCEHLMCDDDAICDELSNQTDYIRGEFFRVFDKHNVERH